MGSRIGDRDRDGGKDRFSVSLTDERDSESEKGNFGKQVRKCLRIIPCHLRDVKVTHIPPRFPTESREPFADSDRSYLVALS